MFAIRKVKKIAVHLLKEVHRSVILVSHDGTQREQNWKDKYLGSTVSKMLTQERPDWCH